MNSLVYIVKNIINMDIYKAVTYSVDRNDNNQTCFPQTLLFYRSLYELVL